MADFNFNPPTGLNDETVFTDNPGSSQAFRSQFMTLFNQIKDFLNLNGGVLRKGDPIGTEYDIESIQEFNENPQYQKVIKYKNGRMVIEQTYAALCAIDKTFGGIKTSQDLEPHNFKVPFKTAPKLKSVSPSYSSSSYLFDVSVKGRATTTKPNNIVLTRGDVAPSQEFGVELVFEGKWK